MMVGPRSHRAVNNTSNSKSKSDNITKQQSTANSKQQLLISTGRATNGHLRAPLISSSSNSVVDNSENLKNETSYGSQSSGSVESNSGDNKPVVRIKSDIELDEQKQPVGDNQRQQQHRQLQYQVHKQLQRIYGADRLHQQQQQQQQPHHRHHHHHQQQKQTHKGPQNQHLKQQQSSLFKQQLERQIQPQLGAQFQQLHRGSATASNNDIDVMVHGGPSTSAFQKQQQQQQQQQQFKATMMKSQHLMMVNNQQQQQQQQQIQDQTYDSLSPASLSKHQLNDSSNFYNTNSHQQHSHSHSHHGHHHHNSEHAIAHQRQPQISAIPEECGDVNGDENGDEDEEEDLLLNDVTNAPKPTKRAAIERKNQLEDLHYATATAAALLSATANAAAAFAATEKQFASRGIGERYSQQQGTNNHLIGNTIYSDTYQEIKKQQQQQQRCLNETHLSALANFKHQKQRAAAIYADALDPINIIGPHDRHFNLDHGALTAASSSSNAIYSPTTTTKPNMVQSQIYGILPPSTSHYQQYQQPITSFQRHHHPLHQLHRRPSPPQPPLRRLNQYQQQQYPHPASYRPQIIAGAHNPVDMLRQHQHQQFQQRLIQQQKILQLQQQQQQTAAAAAAKAQLPTLAILHHGKGASAKADLIGRMLVNNMLAAQQAASVASAAETHYGSTNALAERGGAKMLMADGHSGGLACLARGDKIYRTHPGTVFSVSNGMAAPPSDASGPSNVPLVLDKPIGFIERICRIDLTLFWWSLLIVSFIFMGAVVTISRYIF